LCVTQAGGLFRLMTGDQRERLVENAAVSMQSAPKEIQLRQIAHFHKAGAAHGKGVAKGLGFAVEDAPASAA
jgi:catalase